MFFFEPHDALIGRLYFTQMTGILYMIPPKSSKPCPILSHVHLSEVQLAAGRFAVRQAR